MSILVSIIIIIAVFLAWVFISGSRDESARREQEAIYIETYNINTENRRDILCREGSGIMSSYTQFWIWHDEDTIKGLNYDTEEYFEIEKSSIKYYKLEGEEHYVSSVSGGGGGGVSVGGAIIGGAIAGPAGAIIGGRKKNNDVTTQIRHIDNTETLLVIVKDGEEKYLTFAREMYNYLKDFCPDKEITRIQADKSVFSAEDRIKKLNELLEKELITSEDYELRKKEILADI